MKLSIITINYNNAEGLRKTMESVIKQTYCDFEYIVVDGASTDNSVEIIRTSALYSESINFKWISEPDTGIYNAMNKGIMMATGEYTLMLNSGDFLVDNNVVANIVPLLDGTDIIQGNRLEDLYGKRYRNRGYGKTDIDFFDVMKGHFLHQAAFCRKDLFIKNGLFDESYRMVSDTIFFMKNLGFKNASFKYVDVDVANFDMFGISAEKVGVWAERHRLEDCRMRGEMYSLRLNEFFEKNEKKIRLYDKLYKHKWIWYIVLIASVLSSMFYPNENDVKKEIIH